MKQKSIDTKPQPVQTDICEVFELTPSDELTWTDYLRIIYGEDNTTFFEKQIESDTGKRTGYDRHIKKAVNGERKI